MDTALTAGGVLTVAGVAGYLAGLVAPYPGRAFSVTGVMVGVTLLAIGWGNESETGRQPGREAESRQTGSSEPGGDSA